MGDKITDKVFSYIDAIAAKLGVAAEHVYGLLVKKVITEGITSLATSIMGIIIALVALYLCHKSLKWMRGKIEASNGSKNWMDFPEIIVPTVVVIIFSLLAVCILTFDSIPSSIMKLSNPEYYAIQEILNALK